LGRVLGWRQAWAQLQADLATAGINSPTVADPDMLGRLADVCARACDQILSEELSRSVRDLHDQLLAGAQSPTASPLWNLLAEALPRRDVTQWQRLREELSTLQEIAPAAHRLRDLRGRLSAHAPIWTSRILTDPAAAGDPADFDAAWQWRQ